MTLDQKLSHRLEIRIAAWITAREKELQPVGESLLGLDALVPAEFAPAVRSEK